MHSPTHHVSKVEAHEGVLGEGEAAAHLDDDDPRWQKLAPFKGRPTCLVYAGTSVRKERTYGHTCCSVDTTSGPSMSVSATKTFTGWHTQREAQFTQRNDCSVRLYCPGTNVADWTLLCPYFGITV